MTGRLQGKVVIITGAGSVGAGWGNGRAAAVLFAREGAKVFAVDKNSDTMAETLNLIRDTGEEVHSYEGDVTDSDSVAAMVRTCQNTFGRIDVLVNNVGGPHTGGPVELSEEAWDAQLDFNLKSTYLTCKHTLPLMQQRRAGAIVNIASTSGIRWTGSPQVGYATAKAGIIQFSRVVAVQYAADGIRVNSVVPGQLHTPMVEALEARPSGQRAGGDLETLLKQRQARIPLGFMGDGRDTAYAALFLASDEARFITGTELVVDGGMTARCD
jgi:NAD(P)-dependent dehydrogenase (short-subunit alcohol dehydrogenase family)